MPDNAIHFTPTSSYWLNAVEGFFAKLTRRRLKRGVFRSIIDLRAAINRFIAKYNGIDAKPFKWTADPDKNHRSKKSWVSNVGINPPDAYGERGRTPFTRFVQQSTLQLYINLCFNIFLY